MREEITADQLEHLRAVAERLDPEDAVQLRRLVDEHVLVRTLRDHLKLAVRRMAEENVQLWRLVEQTSKQDLAPLIDVVAVEVLRDHVLRVTFEDGAVKDFDMAPHLWGEAFEPLLADQRLFEAVAVDFDGGTICWPNGADISPRRLYQDGVDVPRPGE